MKRLIVPFLFASLAPVLVLADETPVQVQCFTEKMCVHKISDCIPYDPPSDPRPRVYYTYTIAKKMICVLPNGTVTRFDSVEKPEANWLLNGGYIDRADIKRQCGVSQGLVLNAYGKCE